MSVEGCLAASRIAEHGGLHGALLQVEMFDRSVEPPVLEVEAFCERAREMLARASG